MIVFTTLKNWINSSTTFINQIKNIKATENQIGRFTESFNSMDKEKKGYLTVKELYNYGVMFGIKSNSLEKVKKQVRHALFLQETSDGKLSK